VTRLVALLLIAEGAASGYWIATLLPRLRGLETAVDVLVALRALIAAAEVAAGIALRARRPAGVLLTRSALASSAVLMIFETGWAMAPSDLTPSLRWPIVGGYIAYALLASWLVGRKPRSSENADVSKRPLGLN
jgi:hypothetical protein